jgi:uncharacterized protein YbjT (DUF2867 family)
MILITGASGNVGSEVVKQTATAGLEIRAAYQSADKASAAFPGIETVVLDYQKPETIRQALRGIDTVFLVGPPTSNLPELEANVIDAAKNARIRHLVKLSALGGRKAIFPSLHRQSEEKIEASGIPYSFIRPNGFMQNFVTYNTVTIKSQNAFYGCQGEGAVSHVDIRDVAAAIVAVLSGSGHEGKAYPLTGPEALTQKQVAEKLSKATGRAINYVDLPVADVKKAMLASGMPEWSADAVLDLTRLYRDGGASLVDPTIEQLIGRKRITFDQFARDYANAFRAEERAAS